MLWQPKTLGLSYVFDGLAAMSPMTAVGHSGHLFCLWLRQKQRRRLSPARHSSEEGCVDQRFEQPNASSVRSSATQSDGSTRMSDQKRRQRFEKRRPINRWSPDALAYLREGSWRESHCTRTAIFQLPSILERGSAHCADSARFWSGSRG